MVTARNAARAPWVAARPLLRERLRSTPFFDCEAFGREWVQAV